MERRILNRIVAVILTAIMFIGIIYMSIGTVLAETYWDLQVPESPFAGQTWWLGVGAWDEEADEYLEGTVTSAVSSAPDVITVEKEQWEDADGSKHEDFHFVCKAVGVATITVDFTKPDNTTGTLSKTLKVNEYPNHIKSLKVSGKKVNISKHKYQYQVKKYKKTKGSVKLKLKSGWKLDKVYVNLYDVQKGVSKEIKVSKKAILKGKSIKFPKKYEYMDINMNIKKGDKFISYYVGYSRY